MTKYYNEGLISNNNDIYKCSSNKYNYYDLIIYNSDNKCKYQNKYICVVNPIDSLHYSTKFSSSTDNNNLYDTLELNIINNTFIGIQKYDYLFNLNNKKFN